MTPCGIPADVCPDCANDCACAGHDGRVCVGGAHECTCRTQAPREALSCQHFAGDRGSGWCTAALAPCTVYWQTGACLLKFDADAFRTWAEAKRYSDTTITDAIRKVKRARSLGITRVEEVDEKYPSVSRGSRNSMRTILRMYDDFLEATA